MLHPPKNRFYLHLLVLLPSALAKTKTFKFTDDFYLKFQPLETAIGPDNAGALLSALNAYAEQFKNVWIEQIESELLGGECTVGGMALPEFSICDWKYPDKYDVDELPLAGQCYYYDADTPLSAFVSSMLSLNHQILFSCALIPNIYSIPLITTGATCVLQDQGLGDYLP
jgi:hypothetical protein